MLFCDISISLSFWNVRRSYQAVCLIHTKDLTSFPDLSLKGCPDARCTMPVYSGSGPLTSWGPIKPFSSLLSYEINCHVIRSTSNLYQPRRAFDAQIHDKPLVKVCSIQLWHILWRAIMSSNPPVWEGNPNFLKEKEELFRSENQKIVSTHTLPNQFSRVLTLVKCSTE